MDPAAASRTGREPPPDRWGQGCARGAFGLRAPASGDLLGRRRGPERAKSKMKERRKFERRRCMSSGFGGWVSGENEREAFRSVLWVRCNLRGKRVV